MFSNHLNQNGPMYPGKNSIFKPNFILRTSIFLSILLVICTFFLYRPYAWPLGFEALGCLISVLLLTITFALLWFRKNKIEQKLQIRNVRIGLYLGLLWTIEIGINNIIYPGLPLRDYIDNGFFGLIALLIFFTSIREAFQAKSFSSGFKAGFYSGLASGVVSCLTALLLIVFGMKLLLLDPLNIREWSDVRSTVNSLSMSEYFAYQTLAGAILHLFLGVIMGLFLGAIAGMMVMLKNIFKKE